MHDADPECPPALLKHVDALPTHDRRPSDVGRERVRMCDVVRVERRSEADRDDHDEEDQRRQGNAVPEQPAPGEAPRALS